MSLFSSKMGAVFYATVFTLRLGLYGEVFPRFDGAVIHLPIVLNKFAKENSFCIHTFF